MSPGYGNHRSEDRAHSPWQSPFAERLVGFVRRECLDHVMVLGEQHLRGILTSNFDYYLRSRTHLSLSKDAPLFGGSPARHGKGRGASASRGLIIGTKGEWHSQQESMWLIEGLSVRTGRTRQHQAKTRPPSRFAEPFDN